EDTTAKTESAWGNHCWRRARQRTSKENSRTWLPEVSAPWERLRSSHWLRSGGRFPERQDRRRVALSVAGNMGFHGTCSTRAFHHVRRLALGLPSLSVR